MSFLQKRYKKTLKGDKCKVCMEIGFETKKCTCKFDYEEYEDLEQDLKDRDCISNLYKKLLINDWDKKFLLSYPSYDNPSEKQQKCYEKIKLKLTKLAKKNNKD